MNEIKLCKDCKFMKKERSLLIERTYCTHPNAIRPDRVFGNHTYYSCSVEREYNTKGGCGPDGRNFEPNDSERKTIL